MKYILNPLDETETAQLIQFRLEQAGLSSGRVLFSPEAVRMIYQSTQGYPRKIALLCHSALEQLVMRDSQLVEGRIIQELVANESQWAGADAAA